MAPEAPARPGQRRWTRRAGRRWLVAAGLLVAVLLVRETVAGPLRIAGASMQPTLRDGQVVLVNRLEPALGEIDRGELVAFTSPQDGAVTIKRVVGVAGDSVVIRDAVLEVDGRAVDEPYVDHESIDALYTPTTVVPAGHLFVLGDARALSIDSRDHGPVPLDAVLGTVPVRLWPPAAL